MELFPSKYIHIGGDEAPKFRWEHCPKCQKRMVDLGLKDEHELQSYFITRIENYLNENGRQLIGWDEILEGGLSPNATVQSWRGMEHGKHAAGMKHNVVMSPTSHCYLDYGLDAIDLEKVYRFNPIPEGLEEEFEQYILGGEVNMWTEHVPNDSVLDSKVFPRLIAMAEVLWSGPGGDFEDFYERLQQHYPILEDMGVQYGLEAEPVSVSTFMEDGKVMIKLEPGLQDLRLEYAYDTYGFYTYEQPFPVTITDVLQVQAYKGDEPYGRLYETEVVNHLGLGKTDSTSAFSPYYNAGGTNGLTDGLTGSLNFRDGRWMGFSGVDADVTMDLSSEQELSSLSFHYYLYPDAWIMQPKYVSVYASTNGENWIQIGEEDSFVSTDTGSDKAVCTTQIELKTDSPYRYLRVVIENFGKLPDNHAAAGTDAWIFVDEIIVR
jgi:hexosaminidase